MDKRSPEDIRKSIKSLVEEAESVSIDDNENVEISNKEETSKETKLDSVSLELENKYKKNLIKKNISKEEDNLDLDLSGLISDDVALAVRAELMRFSDVFDTDDTKEIIYKSVTSATREMVREWLDQNLASIAKEVINEALDKLSKNARN
jgi:cell pole-organizing protein PopZ